VGWRRIGSRGSFVRFLSILELGEGPLDLAEKVFESGDGRMDFGRATRKLFAIGGAFSIPVTVSCRGTVAGVRLTSWRYRTIRVGIATIPAVLASISG